MEWTPNKTLDQAFDALLDDTRCHAAFRERLSVVMVLHRPRRRKLLEQALTERMVFVGAIPVAADATAGGIYVGNWLTDLFELLVENWEVILEIISTILIFF